GRFIRFTCSISLQGSSKVHHNGLPSKTLSFSLLFVKSFKRVTHHGRLGGLEKPHRLLLTLHLQDLKTQECKKFNIQMPARTKM
ncbi:hypothetical protein R7Z48_28195, partial [Vibrio sp. 1567]|uniref:hypothetical protein n=1 Tax=Vibrio sp. 1567 TaxID=3074564 RepID=UPI0029641C19